MSQSIVTHDKKLHQDIVTSRIDAGKKTIKCFLAIDQQLRLISAGKRHHGKLLYRTNIRVIDLHDKRLEALTVTRQDSPQYGIAFAPCRDIAIKTWTTKNPESGDCQIRDGQ